MTNKKVSIGIKPSNKPTSTSADAWVESRQNDESEAIKRLTIDIPDYLHRTIKAQCAMRGTKIVDEVRALLIQQYGKK